MPLDCNSISIAYLSSCMLSHIVIHTQTKQHFTSRFKEKNTHLQCFQRRVTLSGDTGNTLNEKAQHLSEPCLAVIPYNVKLTIYREVKHSSLFYSLWFMYAELAVCVCQYRAIFKPLSPHAFLNNSPSHAKRTLTVRCSGNSVLCVNRVVLGVQTLG